MSKKSFIYFFGQALSSILAFALLPFYSKYLSPEEFGLGTLVLVTLALCSTLFNFGLNTGFMIRYFKVDLQTKKLLFTIVIIAYFSIILFSILFFPFNKFIINLFNNKFGHIQYFLMAFVVFFMMYHLLFTTLMKNQQKANLFVLFTVGNSLLIGGLNIYFIIGLKIGYLSFLYSSLISYFIFSLLGISYYKYFLCKFTLLDLKSKGGTLLRISWPLVPAQIGSYILTSGDRYILKSLNGDSSVGIYAIGYRFGSLLQTFLIAPFHASYDPIAYKEYAENIDNFKELQEKYIIVLTLIMILSIIIISIPFEYLFKALIDNRYWPSYNMIGIIALSTVFYGIGSFFDAVMIMKEKLYFGMYIIFFTAALNIILNFALIPYFGFEGAAYATLFCYASGMIASYYINNKLLRINYKLSKVALIVFTGVVIVLIQHIINVDYVVYNILIKSFWAIVGLALLYMLNYRLLKNLKPIKIIIGLFDSKKHYTIR